MKPSIVSRVFLLVLPAILLVESAWAQNAGPIAPAGQIGRAGAGGNMYLSTTLPATGHATHFKKYASAPATGTTLQRARPSVSPYIFMTRPGNPAANYFLGVQPEKQLYDTGAQVQQLNTRLAGIQQDLQRAPRRTPLLREPGVEELSPLKKRANEQRGEPLDEGMLVPTLQKLRSAQNESSQHEQTALKAILDELKAIRESLSPKKEPTEQQKSTDGAESK